MFQRGFHHLNAAWYAATRKADPTLIDEIMFGLYDTDGEARCEMAVLWRMLSGRPTARLEIFDDAWSFLSSAAFIDIFAALSVLKEQSAAEVIDVLIDRGFIDMTVREEPHTPPAEPQPRILADQIGEACWWYLPNNHWRRGKVLAWSTDYEELNAGIGQFPAGIVEDFDTCRLHSVPVNQITFSSQPPTESQNS